VIHIFVSVRADNSFRYLFVNTRALPEVIILPACAK